MSTLMGVTVLLAASLAYVLLSCDSKQQSRADQRSSAGAQQKADQNSMREMMGAMMSGVVSPGMNPDDLPAPSSAGAKLVAGYCAQCHNLPSPVMHSANEWPGIADRMFRRDEMMSRMCGRMRGMGMMGRMGMMNINAPRSEEQGTIVAYLKKYSLPSVRPGALPAPRSAGALLYAATCSRCHALPDPKSHTAAQWPALVAMMQGFMKSSGKAEMTPDEERTILGYLQEHAKASK